MDRRNFLKAASGFALLAAGSMAGVPRAFAGVPKTDEVAIGRAGVAVHDRLLACMSKNRCTNQGVKDLKRQSVHLVSRGVLPEADRAGHAKRRTLARLRFTERMPGKEAYEKHIASAHLQTHKQQTLHTMKPLALSHQSPPNPDNKLTNYIQQLR